MTWLLRFLTLFLPLLRWPLRAWINTHTTPSDLDEIALAGDKPVCYVLPVGSVMDWLALEAACAERGLPRPYLAANRLPRTHRAVVLALPNGKKKSDLTREDVADGRSRFAVVRAVVERIDWLHTHPEGHYRALFEWNDDAFDGNWVVP